MKLTKWSKNKENYAEKSNRIWIATTERNVKGMCNYTNNIAFTVNNNSPIQAYVHPDDQTQSTFEMTPGFKPFTVIPRTKH